MKCVITDTGPLVAILDRQDQDHLWVVDEGRRLPPKMFTCEAVLSEVHFLTRTIPEAKNRSEGWPESPVFTLDSDFRIYRRNKRQSIPLICPTASG